MTIPYLYTEETKLMLQVKKDLDRHEGFRVFAYPDPLSDLYRKYPHLEWGYKSVRELPLPPGTNLDSGKPWTVGFGFTNGVIPDSCINRIRAERKLEELILEMNYTLGQLLPWFKDAPFVTKTVLINMAFNMGVKGLLSFRNTLAFIKAKDYYNAARNMELSLWYRQVGSRAKELVQRMKIQSIEPQHRAEESVC
jgi:lysozyme